MILFVAWMHESIILRACFAVLCQIAAAFTVRSGVSVPKRLFISTPVARQSIIRVNFAADAALPSTCSAAPGPAPSWTRRCVPGTIALGMAAVVVSQLSLQSMPYCLHFATSKPLTDNRHKIARGGIIAITHADGDTIGASVPVRHALFARPGLGPSGARRAALIG